MSDMWGERPTLKQMWGRSGDLIGAGGVLRLGGTFNVAWSPASVVLAPSAERLLAPDTGVPYAQFQLREGIVWGKWSDRGDWSVVA